MKGQKKWAGLGLLTLAILITAGLSLDLFSGNDVQAADHTDPPPNAQGAGDSGDIGDIYAWHKGQGADQKLVTVLTFGGPAEPEVDQAGAYDADTLYTILIDNSGDHMPDLTIYARYGQNPNGDWGVQVIGLPGEPGPVVGSVETTIQGTSSMVWTGLRDDPFFFDLQGFGETASSGTLSFNSSRDFFAGKNITALVLEMPMAAALGAGTSINVWATTAKK